MVTSQNSEDWTLHASECGSALTSSNRTTFTQTSECLRGSALCPPGLLRMSLRCVTCGCHGDAFKNAGRAEVIVQRVGAKSRLVTRLTQCCLVRQSDRPSPPPPGLLEVCVSMHIHTLTRLCLCCVNMLKLIVLQVRTCPYTSLSGLIIHCLTPMTLLLPFQSCCSVICRIQEAALNKNTRNTLLFTSLIQSYTF